MITSSSNQKVKQVVQWQTRARERREAGIFLAEGFKLYQEAPEEDIREVYATPDALERAAGLPEIRDKLKRTGCEVVAGTVFEKMSDTRTPQGILCVIRRPEYSLEQLLSQKAPLFVVLENLQDPGNLGTIIRTGEGAGVSGILMNTGTVDIYNPKTIRATMGSVFGYPLSVQRIWGRLWSSSGEAGCVCWRRTWPVMNPMTAFAIAAGLLS